MIKFCKYCFEHPESNDVGDNGYIPFLYDSDYECPSCGNKLEDVNISVEDYMLIIEVSVDKKFIQSMIKLHDEDPIEYQLKLNQFKLQQEQAENIKEQQRESSKPHCPTCSSTDLKKISTTSKVMNTAMWGIFGTKRHKTYHCNSCGYEW